MFIFQNSENGFEWLVKDEISFTKFQLQNPFSHNHTHNFLPLMLTIQFFNEASYFDLINMTENDQNLAEKIHIDKL